MEQSEPVWRTNPEALKLIHSRPINRMWQHLGKSWGGVIASVYLRPKVCGNAYVSADALGGHRRRYSCAVISAGKGIVARGGAGGGDGGAVAMGGGETLVRGGCEIPIKERIKDVVDGRFREGRGKDLPMGRLLFKRRRDMA
jgi:hypothetical protein